jgi:hypothetical protein
LKISIFSRLRLFFIAKLHSDLMLELFPLLETAEEKTSRAAKLWERICVKKFNISRIPLAGIPFACLVILARSTSSCPFVALP